MGVLRRLWGIVVILRALLPILLVAAAYAVGRGIVADVRQAVAAPTARISRSVEQVRGTVTEAQRQLDTVRGGIDDVSDAARSIADGFDIRLPVVGDVSLNIPGLGAVKGVFGDLADVLGDLADLAGITAVSQEVTVIANETRQASRALAAVVDKWLRIVVVLGLILAALIVTWYLEFVAHSLRRGWALLRGQPDPIWGQR